MEFGVDSIRAAAKRLEDRVVHTPLLQSPQLDELAGARVLVKAECLQLTGAFKLRGALNKVLSLAPDEVSRGVATYSAGNHGQAVAAAARLNGCPAVVVLPRTAPAIKVENCRWWGAETVFYDPRTQGRAEVLDRILQERGMTLVHPFDDHVVMAGQGPVGLEVMEGLHRDGRTADAVVASCSGGGLAAGVRGPSGETGRQASSSSGDRDRPPAATGQTPPARCRGRALLRSVEDMSNTTGTPAAARASDRSPTQHAMSIARRLALPVLTAYLWVTMTLFGAIVLETFMVYPNVFADPPQSLGLAMEFLAVSGPSDFFPPLGFVAWVLGAASLALCWTMPTVRWWVLLSLAMFVAEGVVSMLYFWPRNEVMFVEGAAVHSAEYLRQVADEFTTWHARSRMVFNTTAAVAAFIAFTKAYRHRLLAAGALGERRPRPSATRA